MKYNPETHHRRSIRLQGYNYSKAGSYFITICTQHEKCLFGYILDGMMQLNPAGKVLQKIWDALPEHYSHVRLDSWIIMPNHIHGIIVLNPKKPATGAGFKPASTKLRYLL